MDATLKVEEGSPERKKSSIIQQSDIYHLFNDGLSGEFFFTEFGTVRSTRLELFDRQLIHGVRRSSMLAINQNEPFPNLEPDLESASTQLPNFLSVLINSTSVELCQADKFVPPPSLKALKQQNRSQQLYLKRQMKNQNRSRR